MRHLKSGLKLKRTSSHRKALLKNLATDLLEHKRIETTLAKAKALRPFVEKLITKAKRALLREKLWQQQSTDLVGGHKTQKLDVHSRRLVARFLTRKAVVQELFDTIAPVVLDRPGGYTRIVKTGFRRGDSAEMAVIELVDWGAPQDGNVSLKSRKKVETKQKKTKATKAVKKEAEKPETAATTQLEETPAVEPIPSSEAPETIPETVSEPVKEETSLEQEIVSQAEQAPETPQESESKEREEPKSNEA